MTPRHTFPARRRRRTACALGFLVSTCSFALQAQTAAAGSAAQQGAAQNGPAQSAAADESSSAADASSSLGAQPTSGARRRAAKLYLQGDKLYLAGEFESAMHAYEQAATLDPTNSNYAAAVVVARAHQVTVLVQSAAKARLAGDEATARAALSEALALDPTNPMVTQHLFELGDDALAAQQQPLYNQPPAGFGEPIALAPNKILRSFHLRAPERDVIQQVFSAYGIYVTFDDSIRSPVIRFDLDDTSFAEAMNALSLATATFFVPLDEHRVLLARDTQANRTQFSRMVTETVHLAGLTDTEMTEVNALAKTVFNIQSTAAAPGAPAPAQPAQATPPRPAAANPAQPVAPAVPLANPAQPATTSTAQPTGSSEAADTLTLRATARTLNAFNTTMRALLDGHNQIMLDVRLVQLAHISTRNSGAQLPQSISAANVYSEEQSILNANQALVQQIISSGLASPGDTLAILGILIASGQVSSSLFSNGLALFGGGLTASALSPGSPATFTLNLNSSDTRLLDDVQLRLGDGEVGTLKLGERYPIQTSSYSSVAPNIPNIPGLTGAGASSSLTSLVSSLGGASAAIPQIQYQDLGLTLKVTPKVLRGDEIALTIDMKLDALSGSTLNGNPILNTQDYSSVVTLKEGEAVEVASELDKSQSRSISGTPGLSQIPGMNNAADNNVQKSYATMLIVITPHVVRGTQAAGHTPIIMVEKNAAPAQ